MTMHQRHDQFPSQRTAEQEEERPPVLAAPEREPQIDPRGPRRKHGKAVMAAVASVVAIFGVGGWLGYDALTGDAKAKGPSDDSDRSTSAPERAGTQETEKSEVKLSELTVDSMPIHGPDGEKLTGVGELNTKVAGFNEGVTDHNQAFQNAMEKQIGYIANTGTSKESNDYYEGSANDLNSAGPGLTQVEQNTDLIAKAVDAIYAEPSPHLEQNRDQLTGFVTAVHDSLVEDGVELGAAKDWTDNLRFVIDTSSIDDEGNHVARGHFVPGGMMVEADWKEYFENKVFEGGMVDDGQGGLKLGHLGIFDKPNQSDS